MKSFAKNKNFILYTIGGILLVVLLVFIIVKLSFSAPLENDVEVEENSELKYFINVSYDGVDREGIQSDDTVTSEVKSGNIHVEDKIPEGLIFNGFITTSDGTIGAISRSDGSACSGNVIDDTKEESLIQGKWNDDNTEYTYHGLHYNANTRNVSFTVKNLKAGCVLSVGIITTTPSTIDDPQTSEVEARRDFYNYASARENSLTIDSNTVHVFMGKENIQLYEVSYEYEGIVPQNAPLEPTTSKYANNVKVGVAKDVDIEGYTFSGWDSEDVTLTNKTFKMPQKNVVLKGSFSEINTNKVTYTLTGITPNGYSLPSEKEYYQGSTVGVDTLNPGEVINGYRFLGWTSEDVEVSSDNDFLMPNKDVTFTGEFEEAKYKVEYRFYDIPLPPNAESLLPQTKTYSPGSIVTLEQPSSANGYEFLGWYKDDSFVMPQEDVLIYGEWKVLNGTFAPTITKEIVDEKDMYNPGDVVTFKITVKNNSNFTIKDIVVKELNKDAKFISGSGYVVNTDNFATIESLGANEVINLYSQYIVKSTDKKVKNIVEIIGALADNGYELEDKEYKAEVESGTPARIKVCKKIAGANIGNAFSFKLTSEDGTFETWLSLKNNECKELSLSSGNYKIKEIVPQEYEIKSVTGSVTSDNETLVVQNGKTYIVTYTNEFKKKGFLHSSGNVVNEIKGQKTIALLDIGQNINQKIKRLVQNNTTATYLTTDTNLEKIKKSEELPVNFTPNNNNTISLTTSPDPVYIWYEEEEKTLYYYSEAEVIKMNTSSSSMFSDFQSLNDISGLSGFDTSSVTNMSGMFYFCTNLTDLSPLSNWNTTSVTNMNYMFSVCTNLTDLTPLKDWDTTSVTNMLSMFNRCTNLTTLTGLESWNTTSVTIMHSMFSGCTNLTDLTPLSNWTTTSVTTMYSMFNGCTNLTTLTGLESWDTTKVTSIDSMFGGCTKLTDLNPLSNWDTSKVTHMGSMFSGCTNLTDLTPLSNWATTSVTYMSSMFSGCTNLTDLTPLSNWNTSNVTRMQRMFNGCTNLTDLTPLSNWNTSKVTDMQYMFSGCPKAYGTFTIKGNPTSYYSMFFGAATSGSGIVVNYSKNTTKIDDIINTKSSNSNVVKGVQID